MQKSKRRSLGFTLIELIIVVAIIGILAAIAVASYTAYIVDARIGEAQTVMADIRSKEEAFLQTWGNYRAAPFNPTSLPGNSKLAWDTTQNDWQLLNVVPTGPQYWQYQVITDPTNAAFTTRSGVDTTRPAFVIEARSNMDGVATDYTQLFSDSQNNNLTTINRGD